VRLHTQPAPDADAVRHGVVRGVSPAVAHGDLGRAVIWAASGAGVWRDLSQGRAQGGQAQSGVVTRLAAGRVPQRALDLQVLVEPELAPFAPVAAPLVAAERRVQI